MDREETVYQGKHAHPETEPMGMGTTETHDFGWAMNQLRNGHKISRKGWNGKGMWLKIQRPDFNSKMSRPYVYLKTADNQLVPWTPSQIDLFECDWIVEKE